MSYYDNVLRVAPVSSGNPGLANVNEAKDSERAIGETTAAPDTLIAPPSLTRNTVIVTDTNRMDRLGITSDV